MCGNIKVLYNLEPPATDDEIRASAVQYVRKISGFEKPSGANQAAFDRAINEMTAASRTLIDALTTTAPRRKREPEAKRVHIEDVASFGSGE